MTATGRLVTMIVVTGFLLAAGCGGAGGGDSSGNRADSGSNESSEEGPDNGKLTKDQMFFVEYVSAPNPIVVGKNFRMLVTIYETGARKSKVAPATLTITARLSGSDRKMTAEPQVRPQSNDTYLVGGMKFQKASSSDNPWVVTIEIETAHESDVVDFPIVAKKK